MPASAVLLRLCAGAMLLLAYCAPVAAADGGIAIIVAAGTPAPRITHEQLPLIFERKKIFWDDGQHIHAINLPAGHPLRRAFSTQVFGRAPEDMDGYWRDMYFHGVLPPFVLASEEAVLRFIVSTPGAIGYVSACLADHRVTVLLRLDSGGACPH